MIDRGKVIEGLEETEILLTNALNRSGKMALMGAFRCLNNVSDALTLLKEQETKQVKQVELYGQEDWYGLVCKCPDCKAIWMGSKSETHFCPNCGQEIKWND